MFGDEARAHGYRNFKNLEFITLPFIGKVIYIYHSPSHLQTLRVIILDTVYWLPARQTLSLHLLLVTNLWSRHYYYSHINEINVIGHDMPRISQFEGRRIKMQAHMTLKPESGFLPSMPHCLHALQMRYVQFRKVKHFTEDHRLTCWTGMKTWHIWWGSPSYFYYCFSNNINVLGIFPTTFPYWITRIIGDSVLLNALTPLISKIQSC